MRAMFLTAPGEIREDDVPAPRPGQGQLLLRPLACGLCASELDLYLGRNPWQAYPALLGHEVVGEVVALGPGAAGFAPGETVAAARAGGGYADLTAIDAADALPLPSGMPVEQALAEPLACAVNTVRELAPAPADRIVLLGAGFMGLLLTQLLRPLAPSLLLAAARRPEARELALALGASEACDPAEVQDRVQERTGGQGVDLVIEASGSEPLLAIAAALLRPEGTLGIVGYHQGQGRQVPLHEWNWKALRLANCHFRSPARMVDGARRGLDLVARGALDLRPLLTHRFPLPDLQRAFATAAERPPGFVKAVIVP
jgi:threonine dehydrogenase-like Zn-dependent dehydrogenase